MYHYLEQGDSDGFASLLDQNVVLWYPGRSPARGWRAAESYAGVGRAAHTVSAMFAENNHVAAVGHVTGTDGIGNMIDGDFADIYTFSSSGLLVSQKKYFFVDPAASAHAP